MSDKFYYRAVNSSCTGFLFLLVIMMFIVPSCEDSNNLSQNSDQDTLITNDTVLFQDLTTLFENRCYACHSEKEYSFYALNLDSYENTMLGSQNGPIVIPFDPENSVLYTKCSGEHTDGDRMPQDNLNFFDNHPDKLQLIYDWILYGCLE
jgi:cytochrome c1